MLALLLAVSAAAPPTSTVMLELCRSAHSAFDPATSVKTCNAAADAEGLSTSEHIDALRMLGEAHILDNNEERAIDAFLRMLVLDDGLLLSQEAGPRERSVMARARERLDAEGAVSASLILDGKKLTVHVRDGLGRVAVARVHVKHDQRIAAAELTATGKGAFAGELPRLSDVKDVDYEVVLEGWTGKPLAVGSSLRGRAVQADNLVFINTPGWLLVGGGAFASALVVAVGTPILVVGGERGRGVTGVAYLAALGASVVVMGVGVGMIVTAE